MSIHACYGRSDNLTPRQICDYKAHLFHRPLLFWICLPLVLNIIALSVSLSLFGLAHSSQQGGCKEGGPEGCNNIRRVRTPDQLLFISVEEGGGEEGTGCLSQTATATLGIFSQSDGRRHLSPTRHRVSQQTAAQLLTSSYFCPR